MNSQSLSPKYSSYKCSVCFLTNWAKMSLIICLHESSICFLTTGRLVHVCIQYITWSCILYHLFQIHMLTLLCKKTWHDHARWHSSSNRWSRGVNRTNRYWRQSSIQENRSEMPRNQSLKLYLPDCFSAPASCYVCLIFEWWNMNFWWLRMRGVMRVTSVKMVACMKIC